MIALVTQAETRHGNPGHAHTVPAGKVIYCIPADNLPPTSPIRWWLVRPVSDTAPWWSAGLAAWSACVGVGLHADDVRPAPSYDD
jgi:hypothetical protein